jgi:hypothetical protein
MLVTTIAVCISRFAPKHRDNVYILLISMALVTFILPWNESMFTICFGLNYIPPAFISLIILKLWILPEKNISYAVIPLSLVLGFWHEGFSVPLGVGLGVSMLCCNKWSWSRVLAIAALLPGFVFLLSSPGFFKYNHGITFSEVASHAHAVVKYQMPFFLYTLLCVAIVIRQRNRIKVIGIKKFFEGHVLYIFIFATSVVSILINIVAYYCERSGFIVPIMLSVGLISLVAQWLDDRWFEKSAKAIVVSTTIAVVMFLHLGVGIAYLIPARESYYQILAEMRKNSHGVYFAKNAVINAPLLAWRKLPYTLWTPWNLVCINSYLNREYISNGKPSKHSISVVPVELKNIDVASCPTVNGDTDIHTRNGLLFRCINDYNSGNILIDYGLFKHKVNTVDVSIPYINTSNEKCEWLDLSNYYFPFFLFDIKAIYRDE